MNNEQYQNLMFWYMRYAEFLLKHIADAENVLQNTTNSNDSEEDVYECPVCKSKFSAFLPFGKGFWPNAVGIGFRPHAKCPNCHALDRHRKIWLLMQQLDWYRKGMRVLHFAPELIFYKLFSSFKDIDYWPVDLNPKNRKIKKVVDITDIPFEDNSFDLIMCTHVLEHIPDEKKAMSELYRVLKPKTGIAILNVPIFYIPVTFEEPEYNTPELRKKYYGQHDHVRAYGLDYPQRLGAAGFSVQLFEDIDDKDLKRYGVNKNEKIFWCRKE